MRRTTSLSTASFSRRTPCVLGCCGPMLRPISLTITGPPGEREVLAQRVALELVGQIDPAEVRVAFEADAEHVERLPLSPVRGGIDRDGRGQALPLPDVDGETRPGRAREPVEPVDDGEARASPVRTVEVVEDDEILEGVEPLLVLEKAEDRSDDGLRQADRELARLDLAGKDGAGEVAGQGLERLPEPGDVSFFCGHADRGSPWWGGF